VSERHALTFEGVWKSYPRWTGAGARTSRTILTRRLPEVLRRREQRWALQDVTMRVGQGRMMGIIGANGAGKSTMLRLASGLGRATRGAIVVPDGTASVLSLGDTLDLELTGSENAYTAALIAGMSAAQARQALRSVIAFAELEEFADQPMRTYSEGMKLRLAFGVVAQLQPPALILDEVIAVGDARFQAKCMARIQELRQGGATVVFASHNLDEVAESCDEAIWLQKGKVRAAGGAGEVVEAYRDGMRLDTLAVTPSGEEDDDALLRLGENRFGSQELTIDEVALTGADGRAIDVLGAGGALNVGLTIRSHRGPTPAVVTVGVTRLEDQVMCFETSSEEMGSDLVVDEDGVTLRVAFDPVDLTSGDYAVDVGVYEPGWEYGYDYHWNAHRFEVEDDRGVKGVYVAPRRWAPARAAGQRPSATG
jgi:lipopolysaccharide transport system ATP-binding protein